MGRRSIPRTITWCRTPGASSRAPRGMPGSLRLRWVDWVSAEISHISRNVPFPQRSGTGLSKGSGSTRSSSRRCSVSTIRCVDGIQRPACPWRRSWPIWTWKQCNRRPPLFSEPGWLQTELGERGQPRRLSTAISLRLVGRLQVQDEQDGINQKISEGPAQNQQGAQRHVAAQAEADAKRDGQLSVPRITPPSACFTHCDTCGPSSDSLRHTPDLEDLRCSRIPELIRPDPE